MSRLFCACLVLVICLSLGVTGLEVFPIVHPINVEEKFLLFNIAFVDWLFPVLLIPLYQLLLYRCFRSCSPSMLQCIGVRQCSCVQDLVYTWLRTIVSIRSSWCNSMMCKDTCLVQY